MPSGAVIVQSARSSCNLRADCTMAIAGLAGPAGRPHENGKHSGFPILGTQSRNPAFVESFWGGKEENHWLYKFSVQTNEKTIVTHRLRQKQKEKIHHFPLLSIC